MIGNSRWYKHETVGSLETHEIHRQMSDEVYRICEEATRSAPT